MIIETIKIEDIIPYDKNAKEHTEHQIEQIKNSIKEFGFNDPIAVDENNIIIEGHGRLMALKELGYEEIQCIRLSHLTETKKRAYIIAHNKITNNTGFDLDMLEEEFKNIPEDMLELTGFEDYEIDNILNKEIEEEFDNNEDKEESEKFCLKLFIDREHKRKIESYIDDNGQDKLIEYILDLVVQEED